jgi:ABC-2 type transport system ATP-binding protein
VSILRLEGLRKTYGAVKALDGLDLTVEPGTVFGFLGPNGAGKTTTLRILAGLTHPTSGQAWVAGHAVGPESQARRLIGYLPEEPHFYAWMSAQEFLAEYVGGLFHQDRKEARTRGAELLERVGLEEAARRRIGGFSRGMRQRLGLAQALMNRPQILLLDEPVSALDPGGRRDMLELIGGLREEATVFMSTHILEDVERVCDTVGILNRGRLVALDSREALLSRYAIPAIEVEFQAAPEAIAAWAAGLAGRPGVTGVEQRGDLVRIRLQGNDQANLALQQQILGAGLPVVRYQVARPSLEDVFLHLVEA